MDELNALNTALSNYDDALNEEIASASNKEDKVISFLKDFENIAQTIITPAFEEALESIKRHGHEGRVSIRSFDEASYRREKDKITAVNVTLLVFMKGIKKKRETEPHVFFNARSDAADSRQVNAIYNMFTSGELESGGHLSLGVQSQVSGGSYTLENITHEIAKNEAVKFLTMLFANAKVVK
ncbi:hypothetical protein ACFSUS_28515 [Spirosoma soli]|uniref:Uncharacterized protein n=1 Tax=Spirosoma soli TaxID=1770529 RepID=A0ABW5MDL0_9BACT